VLLAACATPTVSPPSGMAPDVARGFVQAHMPASVNDRPGWATDTVAAFNALDVSASAENLCAVLAVTAQESTFRVDPPVPGLGKLALKEIDRQAEAAGVPSFVAQGALLLTSPDGRSYRDRIADARTEKELSETFDDFIDMVPMGRRFLASRNPVRTGGPMQVSIAWSQQHVDANPYPYPLAGRTVRQEVFTRRGGMYFGIAHLLDYPAQYDRMLYRFADFNAGHYASRNAAFQNAVSKASGIPLVLDGDLLRMGAAAAQGPGQTELATMSLAPRIGLDRSDIRRDLETGTAERFYRTDTYEQVFKLADHLAGAPLPRSMVPSIELHSPKITRKLTTAWFADRVDQRYRQCLSY